jgi:alcohol dehydrogenase/L-iditol 2-dehydrogenase
MASISGGDVAVLGLEQDRTRLQIAANYAKHAIAGDDLAAEWAASGDGLGVDVVIDAAGVSDSLKTAVDLVRPAGWITKVGWGREPLGFSLDPLVQKNVTLQGSFSHNWPVWEKVLELLANGTLDVQPLIGGTWPLEQWEEAFTKMHSGQIAKAVLVP